MSAFVLNQRLADGGFEITRRHGCRILLKNEAQFPWFIIVPEVADGIEDLHQLDGDTYTAVMACVREVSLFVSGHFRSDKLNVACIGNIVRQMHIHVVARETTDPAWPGTVWAHDGKLRYEAGKAQEIIAAAQVAFGSLPS